MARMKVVDTDLDLNVRDGETVLEVIRRAGYAHRWGCRRGGCGVCKVKVEEGSIEYPVTVSEQALSEEERSDGIALSCRAVPTTDVVISVPPDGKLRCVARLLTEIALSEGKSSQNPSDKKISTPDASPSGQDLSQKPRINSSIRH